MRSAYPNHILADMPENIWRRSTIYRRHEKRLAKSYALRNDPRPAPVRVMSLLPVFSLFVPPYQPETSSDQPIQESRAPLGETIFSPQPLLESRLEKEEKPSDIVTPVSQIALGAAVCAGFAEFWIGGLDASRTIVLLQRPSGSLRPGVPVQASVQDGLGTFTMASQHLVAARSVTLSPMNRAFFGGLTTATLFGTRAAVSRHLGDPTHSDPLSANNLLSSAAAGLVSSVIKGAQSHVALRKAYLNPKPLKASPVTRFPTFTVTQTGGEILGVVAYFATYESLKNSFSSNDSGHADSLAICVAGGVAGCARAIVTAGIGRQLGFALLPAMLRTMPANAAFFLGYESLCGSVKSNPVDA